MTTKTMKITIDAHEDKTSKNGKDYTRYSTQAGWMSCFEADVNAQLKKVPSGESREVDVNESEYNGKTQYAIQNLYGETNKPVAREPMKVPSLVKTNNTSASFYTAYSKDIFLGMHEALTRAEVKGDLDEKAIMAKAIELVKQAQEAFN